MVHPPQCPCGSLVYPGPDGRCLTCGRTVTAPGGWRGLGPRLAGVAALTLAGVVAAGFLLARFISRPPATPPTPTAAVSVTPPRQPAPEVKPAPPPRPDSTPRPSQPAPQAEPPDVPVLPDLPDRPSPDKPPPQRPDPPKPPPPPPAPIVAGFEPSEPQAGGKLAVRLQRGGPEGLMRQYRRAGTVDWQPVSEDELLVQDLKPGPLRLEFRTLDPGGRPSPVVRRTWNIKVVPSVVAKAPPGLRQGDRFYQEVVVRRVSTYQVLGAPLGQDVAYVLVSSFHIDKLAADGSMEVTQKVENVRLSNAAPAMQAQLNDLLQKTKGATFTLSLNPRREVTAFKGADEALKVFKGANPLGGQSFLLWSFLDRDGWKELAGITFFRPERPLRRGEKWVHPMTHSWGPLGRWDGKIGYVHAGSKGDRHQFNYLLDMAYRPPAAGAGARLPFKIARADFRVQTARGAIIYDASKGRVAGAEELFHVRGVLAVEVLGSAAPVEMDEKQVFQIRILDRNPLAK